MKWLAALILVLICGVLPGAFGQGLDDEYVQIFRLIQEADALAGPAPSQALAKYLDAQAALDRLHKGSPDWNTRIVNYRLSYLANKIGTLSASHPPAEPTQGNLTNPPAATAQTQPAQATLPSDWEAQMNGVKEQVRQLEADKSLLQAKLKEALAMRPAESDPRELAKADERIKALQKENELLKVGVEKQSQTAPANAKELEQQQQLLAGAKQQIAALQTDKETLRLEKVALETRIKQLSGNNVAPNGSGTLPADAARIQQLESERDNLEKRLDSATKELAGRKSKGTTARSQDLENQLALVRARLEIFEARAVPYSAEELELLKRPQAKLAEADPNAGKKSIRTLPPGGAALVADAQRYFAAKQYDKAEAAYLQVLQMDPKNVPALANLAAIQAEAELFDRADANIKQALALDPEDAYSLYVLGILRFRQAKYDEALDALSHAAKLDPQNADVQNYLGLALSEKGMRVPAEAALRKAIQLQPGYAGAHYNLAVVYATQQPPATELARWHYQKAIAGGHERNLDLEKRFETSQ